MTPQPPDRAEPDERERRLIRDAHKQANKQGRIAASQRRKRKGVEASLDRTLDLLRRALAGGLTPDLEVEIRGAIDHQEALRRKRALEGESRVTEREWTLRLREHPHSHGSQWHVVAPTMGRPGEAVHTTVTVVPKSTLTAEHKRRVAAERERDEYIAKWEPARQGYIDRADALWRAYGGQGRVIDALARQVEALKPIVEAMAKEAPLTKWSLHWINEARAALATSQEERGR